jgi:hypothetical protein
MCHVWKKREINTEFLLENMNERAHLSKRGLVGSIILKCSFMKQDGKAWIGFI